MDPIHEVLGRSALVSLSATAIALVLGVPVGTWLALGRRRGRGVLATAVNTGMAVPTVVVGLVVALLLWRSGPLGHLELIYTLRGMIIAQVLPDQLRALGANTPQLVVRLWLEARVPLLAAAMAGFGHAVAEVGSATIVGGNIHGQTQVMTTSIVENVGKGDFNDALVYAAILIALAFAINAVLTSVQQRAASWAQS